MATDPIRNGQPSPVPGAMGGIPYDTVLYVPAPPEGERGERGRPGVGGDTEPDAGHPPGRIPRDPPPRDPTPPDDGGLGMTHGPFVPCQRIDMPCLELTDYENTVCLQFYGPIPTTPDGRCAGSSVWPGAYPLLWWPEVACVPPCLSQLPCIFPSEAEREEAALAMPTVVLTEESQPAGAMPGDWTGWQLIDPLVGVTNRQHVLINGALALLRANADLLYWAVCVAGKMSRLGFVSGTGPPALPATSTRPEPPHYPQHLSDADIDAVAQAIVDRVNGLSPIDYVYVIQYWEQLETVVVDLGNVVIQFEQMATQGTTGAATNILSYVENGGEGVIIPLGHPVWAFYADQVHNALQSTPSDDAAALCAVTEMCTVLIHEFVHRYLDPGMPLAPGADGQQAGASDSWSCWAIQKMAANTFRWGIHQRYSCTTLYGYPTCPGQGDHGFNWAEWIR